MEAAPDTHGYGVPDFWQDIYTNLQYDTPGQAYTSDYDNDGMNDHEEYLADTNPQDANSILQLDLGSLEVPDSSKGRNYTVERCLDLVRGEWLVWAETLGTGSNLVFDLDMAASGVSNATFRVEANIP